MVSQSSTLRKFFLAQSDTRLSDASNSWTYPRVPIGFNGNSIMIIMFVVSKYGKKVCNTHVQPLVAQLGFSKIL